MPQSINISSSTLLRFILIIIAAVLLYFIRDIILVLFFAIIISSALDPLVKWCTARKIPRAVAVLSIYLILGAIIALIIVLLINPLSEQFTQLARSLPTYYKKFIEKFGVIFPHQSSQADFQSGLENLSGSLSSLAKNLIPAVRGFLGGGISLVLVLVLTFYLIVEDKWLKTFLRAIAPGKHQPYLHQLVNRIQHKMGAWLRGQLLLSAIIFAMTLIALLIFKVKYALVLAFIAGLLEVVPFIGPVLAAAVAVMLTLAISPFKALVIIPIIFLVIQQLENHLIVPKVMQRTVGLNPIVIILVVLIGAKLGGVLGVLVAIPLAAGISEFLKDMQYGNGVAKHEEVIDSIQEDKKDIEIGKLGN